MRIIAVLVLVVGVALAGGAVLYMNKEFQAARAALAKKPTAVAVPVVRVAVAKSDLRFGQRVTKKSFHMVDWPKAAQPKNAFNAIEELFQDGVDNRIVLRRMEPGEVVLRSKVTGFGEKPTLAAILDEGMVAYTMKTNAITSVAGFLFPGTRVDVLFIEGGRRQATRNRYLMSDIEVIAVDQNLDPDSTAARVGKTVTLQVTNMQLRQLLVAEREGTLRLALRGFAAEDVDMDSIMDRRGALGEPEPEPVQVEQKVEVKRDKVKVRRALRDVDTETFEATE